MDNLLSGFGPRWIVVERVQTYTHPLWMLLTIGPCSLGFGYPVPLILQSAVISLAAVGVLALRIARTTASAVLATLALVRLH